MKKRGELQCTNLTTLEAMYPVDPVTYSAVLTTALFGETHITERLFEYTR